MKPYYSDDWVDLYHADCREVIPELAGTYQTAIMDPVWPEASVELVGSEDPYGLLHEAIMLLGGDRLAVQLSCMTDPRFLTAIPEEWPFFRSVMLEYARPSYVGRILQGGDIAYLFGKPPRSREGLRLIPGRMMATNDRDRAGAFLPEQARTLHTDGQRNDTPDIDTARQHPITGKQPLDTKGNSLAVAKPILGGQGNDRRDASSENYVAQPLRANRWGGSDSHGDEGNVVVSPATDADGVREATGLSRRVDTPDGPRYASLGDAVTVPVAEWIGRRIRAWES